MPVDIQHERLCSGTRHRSGGREGKNLVSLSLKKYCTGMVVDLKEVDTKLALIRIFILCKP